MATAGGGVPGVEWPRLDAAFLLDRDIAYMFFGSEFLAYDLAASRVRPGYPRAIAGQWHGLWEDGVDAAVNPGRGKVYFFKDGACSRYDVEHQRVEKGFPRTVGEVFPGLSWRRVDLAFCPGRAGELVFVREREAMVYRDSEAARQLALAESEARARVEAVLGGEMSELAESLHQAWRDDRSRGVTRADGTDSLIADIRRHAELASLAASFAATAARISEDAIGRLGADDVASFASPERWDEREEFARAPESELSIVEYPSPSDSGAARIVELEPSIASEALDEVELDVEIEVDLDGLEDLDEEPAPPGPRRPPPPPRTSE
ncbi:MAG: hypothetical protein H6713_11635 [Myxococcales bacterium]|nr:hypothetical protein [Myxococcales bacterium]